MPTNTGASSSSVSQHDGGTVAGSSVVDEDVVAGVAENDVRSLDSSVSCTDGTAATPLEKVVSGSGNALVCSNSNTARATESPPIWSLTATDSKSGSRYEEEQGESAMDSHQGRASATTPTMRRREHGIFCSFLPEQLAMAVSPSFVFDVEFEAFRLEVAGDDDCGSVGSGKLNTVDDDLYRYMCV